MLWDHDHHVILRTFLARCAAHIYLPRNNGGGYNYGGNNCDNQQTVTKTEKTTITMTEVGFDQAFYICTQPLILQTMSIGGGDKTETIEKTITVTDSSTQVQTTTYVSVSVETQTATKTTTVAETGLSNCLGKVNTFDYFSVSAVLISPKCKASSGLPTGGSNSYNTYATPSSPSYSSSPTDSSYGGSDATTFASGYNSFPSDSSPGGSDATTSASEYSTYPSGSVSGSSDATTTSTSGYNSYPTDSSSGISDATTSTSGYSSYPGGGSSYGGSGY
jgi:hypothetical protein